jgi:uncharacterized tellurite resistance protein B-like protein
MFDQIKNFVAELTGTPETRSFSPDDFRLAAVALLIHLASADGTFSAPERQRLRDLIETRFGLDAETTTRLIELGEVQDRQAVDFYHFTHALARALDQDGRQKIIAMMWEIAFADGTLTEVEESLVARIADLLGVSRQDRLRLRRQVADAVAAGTAFAGPWSPAMTKASLP